MTTKRYVMRFFVPLLFLVTGLSSIQAQGSVQVTADAPVSRLLNAFMQANEETTTVQGWRVQILATTDRQRLETVESRFERQYPSVPVDWVHTSPYYKLRAGAFLTKLEAERLKFSLSREFEGVYLVRDEVEESELLRMY
ncbi:MAG: SPOR domain-containing protein [Bacteroidota bacterium]